MKDAAENNTKYHGKSIKRLISKLFFDPMFVGQVRVEATAYLVGTFYKEYSDFTLCTKKIFFPYMCLIT